LKSNKRLSVGKLPPRQLKAFLEALTPAPDDVVLGPRYGEDAAVLDMGDRYLVIAMDPVTLSGEPGRIAVQINANDIAVMGANPRWMLATVLLPAGSSSDEAGAVMDQLREGCESLDIALVGGHTEITSAVNHTVVAACMVGEVAPDRVMTSSGAQPDDRLVLAGGVAIEGTAILAREYPDLLRARGVSETVIEEAAGWLSDPGISVMPAANALMEELLPHAMHDPTEGGVLSAVHELAAASGLGIRFDAEDVPVLPACSAICSALDLDPLGLLASGSLLAAVAPEDEARALKALAGAGIAGSSIGQFLEVTGGIICSREGQRGDLALPERDELARWTSENAKARGET
jgi:hydrogenase expression/formation protein HypE